MDPVARASPPRLVPVARRFLWGNLAVSLVAAAGGAAVLLHELTAPFWHPVIVAIALLGVPGGLVLLRQVRARVCVRCGERLHLRLLAHHCAEPEALASALRLGDGAEALRLLGPPDAGGALRAELWYCPECRAVCAVRVGGEEAFAAGEAPARAIDRVVPREPEEA